MGQGKCDYYIQVYIDDENIEDQGERDVWLWKDEDFDLSDPDHVWMSGKNLDWTDKQREKYENFVTD